MNKLFNTNIIIGKGFLGGYILQKFQEKQISVEGTNYHDISNSIKLDATNLNEVKKILTSLKPQTVINCVGTGNVDFLEKNPSIAYKINSDSAKNIAKICKQLGIKLIHISTDSVFDGKKGMYKEFDSTNPLNVYAKSKVLAEQYIQDHLENSIIVRTNFYGFTQKNRWFFNWIIDSLSNKKKITGFSDIIFNPLEVSNLSNLLVELTESNYTGIIHLSSNNSISKYDFILKVASVFEFDKSLIKKGNYITSSLIAKRPKNTTLNHSLSTNILKTPIISLSSSLESIKKEFY